MRMAKQFTEWAKEALNGARAEAGRAGEGFVRTEHLLLALCRDQESAASRVLAGLGVDIQALITDIECSLDPVTGTVNTDEVLFTPHAKKVIELAIAEAQRLNHDYIGTEHLLLGLLIGGEGLAARLLKDRGADHVCVKAEIERLSEPDGPDAANGDAFELTPRAKEALERALSEMTKEREAAACGGEYEKAAWWRAKELVIMNLLGGVRQEGESYSDGPPS